MSTQPSFGRRRGVTDAGEKNGGTVLLSGGFYWTTAAHELGHAFDLKHDFRDGAYIMSYGPGMDQLSSCHAEFLSVHPYFNPDIPNEDTPSPTIELISSPEYPAGSTSVSIQLRVSDPDGLHQAILFVSTIAPHPATGFLEVKACRGLNGERDAVVQFDYDGVIPSSSTSLSYPTTHPIFVQTVDNRGNVDKRSFKHMQRYINRVLFRINRISKAGRPMTAWDRINELLSQCMTARTTYKQLVRGEA